MKAFYGVLIALDVMRMDRDELYWSKSEKHFMVGSKIPIVFTRDRFFSIKKYLHFSDDTVIPPNDKLHKVRYMLDKLVANFQHEYNPHREMSVDEAMVPFKGRLGWKQYMKDKPIKFGIKLWVAADAITAYCFNLDVYVGKAATEVLPAFGLSGQVVVNLLTSVLGNGHIIFTDSFYTSPILATYLLTQVRVYCPLYILI